MAPKVEQVACHKGLDHKDLYGGRATDDHKKQTLLLVESHRFLRDVFRQILTDQSDLEIIGQAEDGAQAVVQAVRLLPELVVMDMTLPDMTGLVATRLIRELVPHAQVILLVEEACKEYIEAAVTSGAQACVVKTMAGRELAAVLEDIK
jgi:two-component system, NarL family, response regulator NreC